MTDERVDFNTLVEEDAAEAPTVSDGSLTEIAGMTKMVVEYEELIGMQEEALKKVRAELRAITEDRLPQAMLGVGMKTFTTDEGFKVSIKEDYAATISAANKEKAHEWLRDNGHAALIKSDVNFKFGMDESEKADELMIIANAAGFPDFSRKETVHSGTLRAFVREQMTTGQNIPEDLFSVFAITIAQVKR